MCVSNVHECKRNNGALLQAQVKVTSAALQGKWLTIYEHLYVLFVNPTDTSDNEIRLLKTDLNLLILCPLDQATF